MRSSSLAPRAPLLAATALATLLGCSSNTAMQPAPTGCSRDFLTMTNAWVDPAVVDPRPAGSASCQPTPTFQLSIGCFDNGTTGLEVRLDSQGTLFSSDCYQLPFEAGPSHCEPSCAGDPNSFDCLVPYLLAHSSRMERLTGQLSGGHLVGTLTIEGQLTTFDAAMQ